MDASTVKNCHKFKLSDFCDGYVFQKHIENYEGCAVYFLYELREGKLNPILKFEHKHRK